MNRMQVLRYVKAQYGVDGQYKWRRFPDDCVLVCPVTGKWFALLISRNPDVTHLTEDRRENFLEINYGEGATKLRQQGVFNAPTRMAAGSWVSIRLDDKTPIEAVKKALDHAFDRARQTQVVQEKEHLITVVPFAGEEDGFSDQPLPKPTHVQPKQQLKMPEPIRKMRAKYDYTLPPLQGRNQNFYQQGKLMADYEDDYKYLGDFRHFFPTYHDMTVGQLRGYFTWRTKLRKGKIEKAPTSFAYVYLYELLNQIGVSSVQDGYQKLTAFPRQYANFADEQMLKYLAQWRKDYVVYYQMGDQEKQAEFGDEIKVDHAYEVLKNVDDAQDDQVYRALASLASYKLDKCPLMKDHPAAVYRIVHLTWASLLQTPQVNIMQNLLGWRGEVQVHLFGNAVFYDRQPVRTTQYEIDDVRKYVCEWGKWRRQTFTPVKGRKQKINHLLHEIDRSIRQSTRAGRPLKPQDVPDYELAAIKKAIQQYREEQVIARRPKLDLSHANLQKIRDDASATQESLLTEEERQAEAAEASQAKHEQTAANAVASQSPLSSAPASEAAEVFAPPFDEEIAGDDDQPQLSSDESYFLAHLLKGQPWQNYLRDHHLMASIVADSINEKMMDIIGDTVIEFDDQGQPQIVEDYRPDIEDLLKAGESDAQD